ncbi:MAG: putative holliday junction resolvase [Parcubacteria group bacterium Gr01-1014_33]|nr:MAG: putative holliday junction resolvase [Parcubacteria group bacterium Gr01-1014_33]
MRYLGIDYGEKRIGIALSDPEGRIAFPETTLFQPNAARVVKKIKTLLEKERVSTIVIGLPLGLDGKETEESHAVRRFAEKIKKSISLPIEFENEMFTSRMVEHKGVKKEHTDAAAAAVILQSYLDKQDANDKRI